MAVLNAFGLAGAPARLQGGQGDTWRLGDVVLKPCGDVDEAIWAAGVFATLEGPGFRVPRPRRAVDGQWLAAGWAAWQFIEGEHAGRNGGRWLETIAACETFHNALARIRRPAFLNRRTDAWSRADRMAWGESPLDVLPECESLVRRLTALLQPLELPAQVVHGDFTANVLFAEGLPPGVIDFSPYWRPAGFAVGVIVADALTWGGADVSILDWAAHLPAFPQLLLRAELRRVLELDQHARDGRVRFDQLPAHEPTVALIASVVATAG
ncbi:MAG: TIGR02569 family protein [Tepidiformaceae bacterium]